MRWRRASRGRSKEVWALVKQCQFAVQKRESAGITRGRWKLALNIGTGARAVWLYPLY
jgi:hypothetical protein